jgi:hypothetical protein
VVLCTFFVSCGSLPDHASHGKVADDARPLVALPDAMRIHMLANMRDHLLALQQIHEALGHEQFDVAASVAEERLGLTSLKLHGAHDIAAFMPQGMQNAGTGMHRAASRFAVAARDAGATGDIKPALAALSTLTAQCVACHAGWRVQ